jgi:hypothetical protein
LPRTGREEELHINRGNGIDGVARKKKSEQKNIMTMHYPSVKKSNK